MNKKSSRHAKITGDFGEAVMLYWLSRHGYESARIDHTGIDIIARKPRSSELMGISVKSRSRDEGGEDDYLRIKKDHIAKAKNACSVFKCKLYFGIVVDARKNLRCYLVPQVAFMNHVRKSKSYVGWKMDAKSRKKYEQDDRITCIKLHVETPHW